MAEPIKHKAIDILAIESKPISRVQPRQVSTGNTRGDQIVKGRILVVDDSGLTRMVIGYDKDKF